MSTKEHVSPKRIILVEGILIFSHPELLELLDIKIFVDTDCAPRRAARGSTARDAALRGAALRGAALRDALCLRRLDSAGVTCRAPTHVAVGSLEAGSKAPRARMWRA
eukprot:1004144-Pleurochrysis_carterae.AAC.1